jgi:nitrogen fixation NifU-like protein
VKVEEMYQEIILDHYRAKHHSGLRDPYEAEVHHVNPSCGDEVTLRVHLDGSTVGDVSYEGLGCSISQASTSVMSDLVIGRDVADGLELHQEFLTLMQSKGTLEPDEDRLEDGIAFAGVSKFPARVKCALLGWSAFKDAVLRAQAEQGAEPHAVPNPDEQGAAR